MDGLCAGTAGSHVVGGALRRFFKIVGRAAAGGRRPGNNAPAPAPAPPPTLVPKLQRLTIKQELAAAKTQPTVAQNC